MLDIESTQKVVVVVVVVVWVYGTHINVIKESSIKKLKEI